MANRKTRGTLGVVFGLMYLGLASTAQAQISPDFMNTSSVEARASITIPFGGDRKSKQAKPQFALGLRSETPRSNNFASNHLDWALRSPFNAVERREVKLAFTLEDKPAMLLNDQVILSEGQLYAKDDNSGTLDTYDKTVLTVIGVSLVVIAGTIIIISD